jgi:hypothetical protein
MRKPVEKLRPRIRLVVFSFYSRSRRNEPKPAKTEITLRINSKTEELGFG